MVKSWQKIVVWLSLSIAVLSACGIIFDNKDAVVLDVNLGEEPATLDPALAWDEASINSVKQMFVGLTTVDPRTMEVIPELAERWEVSADGLTWIFYLRQDLWWVQHAAKNEIVQQRPVSAHDVEYGLKRSLAPDTAADYAHLLYVIAGAQAAHRGAGSMDEVGVSVIDDYTIEFTLVEPAGYFPLLLASGVAYPQPREPIEAHGEKWTHPNNIWTNGAFVLKEWTRHERIIWLKNPHYPAAAQVQITEVRAVIVPDTQTALTMYENHELDTYGGGLSFLAAADVARLKSVLLLDAELRANPALCTYYYGFVNTKPPFDNHLVRKAFSAALERQRLIDEVAGEMQLAATSFASPSIFGNTADNPAIGVGNDCPRAQQYLAEAGYPDGEGFPEVLLIYNTSEKQARIAQAVQQMWRECLHVQVEIADYEWKTYLSQIQPDAPLADAPHIFRLSWCAEYPDQHNGLYQEFHVEGSANFLRRAPSKFDELTAQAAQTADALHRQELYKQAEFELLNVETALLPIYYDTTLSLVKPWLTRDVSAWGGQNFKDWRIDVKMKNAARRN